jgi:hypothetical protein
MTKKVEIDGVEFEMHTPEDIAKMGAILVAIPAKFVTDLLGEAVPGTKGGFACRLCGQDCILAPSGQHQYSLGNPLFCFECAEQLIKTKTKS